MKYSKKTCVHDSALVALNADREKYLNDEISDNGSTIGSSYVYCHDSKELNFFEVLRKFKWWICKSNITSEVSGERERKHIAFR